jgi:hypothetical protein
MTNLKGTYHNKGLNIYVTLANSGPTQTLDFDGENLSLSDGGGSVKLVERKVFTPENGFSGSIEQTEILGLPYDGSGAIYMELDAVVQALNAFPVLPPIPPPPGEPLPPPPPEFVEFLLFDAPAEGVGLTFELFQSPEELENFWAALIEADTSHETKESIQYLTGINGAEHTWSGTRDPDSIAFNFYLLNERYEIYIKDGKTWLKFNWQFDGHYHFMNYILKIVPLKDAVAPELPPTQPGP